MTKQTFTRDEVKALLREAIQRRRNDAEPIEDIKTDAKSEKTYTREEVEALIRKDRETRKA